MDIQGKPIDTDVEGYLRNLDDWSEAAAEQLASSVDIEMTEAHWEVVKLLREVYQEFQHSPITRVFVKLMGERLGKDKGRSLYLLQLFPETPMRKACKIAGLPKPTNCF